LVSTSSTFYARILRQDFGAKNYKAETKLVKACLALSYKKRMHKMLMKLTSVLIFFFFPRPPLSQDITDKNGEVLPKGELTGDAEKKIGKKSERLFLKNCFFFEA